MIRSVVGNLADDEMPLEDRRIADLTHVGV